MASLKITTDCTQKNKQKINLRVKEQVTNKAGLVGQFLKTRNILTWNSWGCSFPSLALAASVNTSWAIATRPYKEISNFKNKDTDL